MIIDIVEDPKAHPFNPDEFTLTNDGEKKTDDSITVAVSGFQFTHDTIEQTIEASEMLLRDKTEWTAFRFDSLKIDWNAYAVYLQFKILGKGA